MNIKAEKRPSAKELLNHPFIVEKARGCALISELVSNSIDEINKYRIERFNPDNEEDEVDDEEEGGENSEEGQEACGTVINNEENNDFGTMIVNSQTAKKNTIQGGTILNNQGGKEKKEAPEFMKYINEMEISYDEIKLESDLFQQMEKRKKGNDDDLRALNLMDEDNATGTINHNRTITMDKDSISSENSKSVNKKNEAKNYSTKNMYDFSNSKQRDEISQHESSNNYSEMIDKKSFIDGTHENLSKNYYSNNIPSDPKIDEKLALRVDSSIISKEQNNSTIKQNLNKPLLLNPHNILKQVGKVDSKEIIELLEDSQLKVMGVSSIEEDLKNMYLSMEREIEMIRAKYSGKIKKYNLAMEFLKTNPHLRNLKEYEDYSKFSRFLDTSKFSMYSGDGEGSIGGSSILPLNNVKVHKYKDNNINSKNQR